MTTLFGQKVFCCVLVLVIACFSDRIKMLFHHGKFNQTVLIYLHSLAISAWIGIQAWVIFVAGITMYFNMPRHVFGHIQSKLWPIYFKLGTCLTVIALLTSGSVLRLKEKKTPIEEFQPLLIDGRELTHYFYQQHISGLLVSLLCGVLNCFVFEPNATGLWMERFAFEKERGFGNEIGPIKDKDLLANQKYKELTHQFAKYHGMSSLATVFSFIGGLVYLWYLTCHFISTTQSIIST
ncbi:hypothetical protein QZH41_019590 [Actinostola sp. cb2023]|nr:hypothetical protein QZH41_019590 [Actinostola sp. cb2023]